MRRLRWWWPCAALLVLTLSAAVWSEFRTLCWREDSNGVCNRFMLSRGGVWLTWRTSPDDVFLSGIHPFPPGWSVVERGVLGYLPDRVWLPTVWRYSGAIGTYWDIRIPLWIPALAPGGLCWWGWRRGRAPISGHCTKCGYDLRGLRSAACPECGSVVPS